MPASEDIRNLKIASSAYILVLVLLLGAYFVTGVMALMGTLFIMADKPAADPLASIVVATIIAYNGVKLFRENFSLLSGRSPGPEYLENIEKQARSVPGVLGVHDLRAEYVGPETVHAGIHIEVQSG